MTDVLEHARDILERGGYRVAEVRPLPTGYGSQLRCGGGEVLVAYLSGKFVAQGKNAGAVKALFDAAPTLPKPAPAAKAKNAEAAAGRSEAVLGEVAHYIPKLPAGWDDGPWDGFSPPW